MKSRYTNLYQLDSMLYAPGAPVLILGGSLLRDTFSGNQLCRLRLSSLGKKQPKAVTVSVCMMDASGQPMEPEVRHQYQELSVSPNGEFGHKVSIPLPRRDVCSFTVKLCEVLFEDGELWQPAPDDTLLSLPKQQTLEEAYGDVQLAEQFRIHFGPDCRYLPATESDLWFCTCGTVNRGSEANCRSCHRVLSALLQVNTEALRQEAANRQVREQQVEEEPVSPAPVRPKRNLKKWLLAAAVVALLVLAAGLLKVVPEYRQQTQSYEAACALLSDGKYDEAAKAFEALGDYRDSREQAEKNIPYLRALELLASADEDDAGALSQVGLSRSDITEETTAAMLLYGAAAEQFEALDGYRDSAACIERCQQGIERCRQEIEDRKQQLLREAYDAAVELLDSGSYSQARLQFLELGDYSDSADLAVEAVYRKAFNLYELICRYDIRGISAEFSMDPEHESTFALSRDAAARLGTQCEEDLKSSCGNDPVTVILTDKPGENLHPLADCVTEVFEQLDGYRDSAACMEGILDATDYTKEFYTLCSSGDLYGALDWLDSNKEEDIPDRKVWREKLEQYLPYCAFWTVHKGDMTAIPMAAGRTEPCYGVSTCILLAEGEDPVLRLSAYDGEDYSLDMYVEPDGTSFRNADSPPFNYYLVLNNAGRLSFLKYDGDGHVVTSCEYSQEY